MDLHTALRTRRTIQRFAPGPVDRSVLERAFEAATFAPNHKLTWPFRFVLAGPDARQVVYRVSLRLKAEKKGATPELERAVRAKTLDPAELVVVAQVLADDPHRREEDYAACCAATQNLMLSLHADGVGTMWGTGGATRDPEALAALGLDAARHRVVGFVWVGRAEVVPQAPRRPPLEELVSRSA